ncbi:hypothetical protein [Trichothermofontia sp.]
MTAIDEMTEEQWQLAHEIAQSLVSTETDVNEVRKSIAYLRYAIAQNPTQAGKKFFSYLKTLVNQGKSIGHSNQTQDYYRNLEKACSRYLKDYQSQPAVLLHILSWVARLMLYYKNGGILEETATLDTTKKDDRSQASERQLAIQTAAQAHHFQVGQRVEAIVADIKGKKVTYDICKIMRLTQKEPQKASHFSVGQTVTVEILDMREDGRIKRIKSVD